MNGPECQKNSHDSKLEVYDSWLQYKNVSLMSKVDTRKLGTRQAMTHCTVEYYPHYMCQVTQL